jgi:hypothetical protein
LRNAHYERCVSDVIVVDLDPGSGRFGDDLDGFTQRKRRLDWMVGAGRRFLRDVGITRARTAGLE